MKPGSILALLLVTWGCRGRESATTAKPESQSASVQSTTTRTDSQSASAPSTLAASCNPAVAGLYTDLRTSSVTGDFGGFAIDLKCAAGVYRAAVTVAEGVPEPAVDAPAQVHDTIVHITLPANSRLSGMESFDGVVTKGRLVGRFANDVSVDLPRQQ